MSILYWLSAFCLFVCLSICLSFYLSVCLSNCLCQFVCPSSSWCWPAAGMEWNRDGGSHLAWVSAGEMERGDATGCEEIFVKKIWKYDFFLGNMKIYWWVSVFFCQSSTSLSNVKNGSEAKLIFFLCWVFFWIYHIIYQAQSPADTQTVDYKRDRRWARQ